MVETNKTEQDNKRSSRKRKWETIGRVLGLLGGLFWLVVFVKIVQTSYLTWIGITVGALIIIPAFFSPIFGFAGMKRLEKALTWFWGGIIILIILIALVMLIRPEDSHTWRPYKFDNELAVLEAKRNVPDEENAALRYESLLTRIDIHDYPDFFGEIRQKPWTSNDFPQASRWLDEHAGIIDELLLIGEMEKCRWPIQIDAVDDSTVPYEPISYCTWLIVAAGYRDLGEGRLQDALEKSFCLFGIARHQYQQTQNMDFLRGLEYELTAMKMIRFLIIRNDLLEENINQIAECLPTVENNCQQIISKLMEYEKYRFANIMSVAYEINEKGCIRFSTSSETLFLDKLMWEYPKRTDRLRRLYRMINMPIDPKGVWDMAEAEAAGFLNFLEQDQIPDIDKVTDQWLFGSFTDMVANTHRWAAKRVCFNNPLYAELKPFYLSHITQRRGTWLVLGLRKYRNIHGTWPVRLEQVSDYVPPEAFIDITNGDGFVYRLEGDNFRLYGKGFNGVDDDSQDIESSKDDIVIWPPRERETRDKETKK